MFDRYALRYHLKKLRFEKRFEKLIYVLPILARKSM